MSTLNTIEVTREGLLKAGFVPMQVWESSPMGGQRLAESPGLLVHGSLKAGLDYPVSLHPNIVSTCPAIQMYGNHYEAKYGAQYFILRTDDQLQGFMNVFNYPFP